MSFSRWFKITEKLNLHYKTRLLYYQDLPPFHFIAINPEKIFNKCSNLTNLASQGFAEKFDEQGKGELLARNGQALLFFKYESIPLINPNFCLLHNEDETTVKFEQGLCVGLFCLF